MQQALTETQLAYVAGFLDGEGTLVIYKAVRRGQRSLAYRGLVAIANTHVPTLRLLKGWLGGRVVEQGIGKRCYSLTFSTNEVRRWLPEVLPYMLTKRAQARILLAFLARQQAYGFAPATPDVLSFYEGCLRQIHQLKLRRYCFKERRRVLGEKACEHCGTTFLLVSCSPRRRFCNRSCRNKAGIERFLKRLAQKEGGLVQGTPLGAPAVPLTRE